MVEHAGELWLVMEYVEGETLRHRLRRTISRDDFFTIATQCCEGLQAAHDEGIVHGDIKPENIMLKSSGLTLNQSYPYTVSQAGPQGVTKNVKIVTGVRLQKSAQERSQDRLT